MGENFTGGGVRLPEDDLIEFALKFYASDDVAPFLLSLQEDFRADVNVIIYGIWIAKGRQKAVSLEEMGELDDFNSQWRKSVIIPLRAVRKLLNKGTPADANSPVAAFREKLLSVEIEAEITALKLLAKNFRLASAQGVNSDREAIFDSAMNAYAHYSKKPAPPEIEEKLKSIARIAQST